MIALLAVELNLRWFGVARPAHHHDASATGSSRSTHVHHGGIGFIIVDPQLRVNTLERDTHGALALRLHREGSEPICVIGVYNPPQSSILNAEGKGYSKKLLTSVAEMVAHWRRKFPDTLVTGDLNLRFGNVPGLHETDDVGISSQPFRRWCQHVRLVPAHGKPPTISDDIMARRWDLLAPSASAPSSANRARCTSAPPSARTSFTSEVDYILVDVGMDNQRVTVSYDTACDGPYPSTHKPVSLQLKLRPAGERPPAKPPARERIPSSDYGDVEFWNAAAAHIREVLPALRTLAADRTADPAAVLHALEDAHKRAMHAAAAVHGQARYHGIRHRYKGARTPPWVDALFDRARTLRKAYLQLCRRAARARRRDRNGSPSLEAATARAKADSDEANSAARSAAKRIIASRIHEALQRLERSRYVNPHRMYTTLRAITGDTPSTFTHSKGIPGDNAVDDFSAAFAELYNESRAAETIAGLSSKREFWREFIPAVDATARTQYAAMIDSPITAYEVYLAVFPVSKALAPHLPLAGHGNCTLCQLHRSQIDEWDPSDPSSPAPDLGAHIHGGKAPGSANITAEMLRFPRQSTGDRFHDRIEYCKVLATVFESYMATGDVPHTPSWTDSIITPILKKSVPGHKVDPEDPDDYRGIATGNLIPKVFGLVLLRRLMHWCVATGVIPANQAGFMVHNSAEFQVFAALETLRYRKRISADTYLLFLDLRKAYDSVPQEGLWYVLRTMGVPDRLVRLLEAWNNARRCSVRVNGHLSEAFPVSKGLPQGDVLSPLLFNLYITVLMKRIQLLEGYTGVSWTGCTPAPTIKDLWYADDMLALAPTRQQLQLLLDAIHEWSVDWGIAIGVGNGKTNAMFVPHGRDATQPTTPLMAGTAEVPWTTEYRYLGFNLQPDLARTHYFAAIQTRMKRVKALYLTHNRVVQELSVTTQLQLVNTLILGCANYLMAIVPMSDTELAALDTILNKASRQILGAHHITPLTMLAADSRTPAMTAITLQHRLRFEQTLARLPNQSTPAVRVMLALRSLPAVPRGAGNTRSWVAHTTDLAQAALATTAVPPGAAAAQLWQVHTTSSREGRRYGYALNRSKIVTTVDMVVGQAPTAHTPTAMAAFLQCAGRNDPPVLADHGQRLLDVLGEHPSLSPAAAYGAGGNGSLFALSTLTTKQALVLQRFRLGHAAMILWPFAAPQPAEETESSLFAKRVSAMPSEDCHLCRAGPVSPWHLVASCSHDHIQQWRRQTQAAATLLVQTLCTVITAAHLRLPNPVPAAVTDACDTLSAAVLNPDWDTVDGTQLLMRLLCGAPFSGRDIRDPAPMTTRPRRTDAAADFGPLPLCTAFAAVLDLTVLPRYLMRAYANTWLRWAHRQVRELAGIFTCASRSASKFIPCSICSHDAQSETSTASTNELDLHECAVDAASTSS